MGMIDGNSLVSGKMSFVKNIVSDEITDDGISVNLSKIDDKKRLVRVGLNGGRKNNGRVDWIKYISPGNTIDSFRILLVASEKNCQSMRITLSSHLSMNIDYFETRSGRHSLHVIDHERIDLIIFGDGIEDMDGLEFLDMLNRKFGEQKIPVIEILESDDINSGVQAMKMGAHDYLLKDASGYHFELLPILVARIYAEKQAMNVFRQTVCIHQTLSENIPSVIYQLSLQGGQHDIRISPQIMELGLSPEKWGSDAELHHQMCHIEDRPIVRKALEHSYNTGADFQCDYRVKAFGEKLCWFRDRAKVFMDKYGNPLFMQGVMTEITNQKLLELELMQYRNVLDKLVEQRTERLNKRVAILESCNLNLGANNDQLHQKYIELLNRLMAYEGGAGEKFGF